MVKIKLQLLRSKTKKFIVLLHLSTHIKSYTEAKGFEPLKPCGLSVFKTDCLSHSHTLPKIYTEEVGFEPTVPFRTRLFSRQLL